MPALTPRALADQMRRFADEAERLDAASNWIAAFRSGRVLTTSQAADIAELSTQTIRAWAESADTTDRPLGFRIGDLWLIDQDELFRQIELRRDLHARRKAEANARKNAPALPSPNISTRDLAVAKL
jgi:hypothetical protein